MLKTRLENEGCKTTTICSQLKLPAARWQNVIKVFEEKKVRIVWDDEQEEGYFFIVDVVAILTDSLNPRNY